MRSLLLEEYFEGKSSYIVADLLTKEWRSSFAKGSLSRRGQRCHALRDAISESEEDVKCEQMLPESIKLYWSSREKLKALGRKSLVCDSRCWSPIARKEFLSSSGNLCETQVDAATKEKD